jgi:hypothetical protein
MIWAAGSDSALLRRRPPSMGQGEDNGAEEIHRLALQLRRKL